LPSRCQITQKFEKLLTMIQNRGKEGRISARKGRRDRFVRNLEKKDFVRSLLACILTPRWGGIKGA